MLRSSHQSLPQAREGAAAVVNVHAELRGRHGRLPCQSWLHYEDARDRLVGGMVTRRKTMYTYYGGAEATQRRKHMRTSSKAHTQASLCNRRCLPRLLHGVEVVAVLHQNGVHRWRHAIQGARYLRRIMAHDGLVSNLNPYSGKIVVQMLREMLILHARARTRVSNVAESTNPKQIRNALQRSYA